MEMIAARTTNCLYTIIILFSTYLIIVNNQPIPPGFPAAQTVVEGGNATFRCIVNDNENAEAVLVAIAWERVNSNGQIYYILTGPRYRFLMNNQILTVTDISTDDAGDYYCVLYWNNPDSEAHGNHSTLNVIEQAAIDLPDNVEEVIGHNVTINGVIRGGSYVTLHKRNVAAGKFEDLYTSKYSVLNNTITIYFLSAVDGGEYRACVTSLEVPSNMACTDFIITVTGFPLISLVPLITVSNGSSCTITCNVTGPYTEDLQMTWQRMDGLPLTGQVTQPTSKTQLQLYIKSVTEVVHYQCIANNSLGINAMVTIIDVASCVPDSPSITSLSCSNSTMSIAWDSAETDNNLPTAFAVQVNKVTYEVSPSTNSLQIHGCEDSIVLVTAENKCGKSIPAMATMSTTTIYDASSSTANANDPAGKDQTIIIGMAVLSVLTTTILTIIILISWRKITLLKRQMIE